ncbi:MAG TPA: DUF192 domain-containing protein, partial [Verrucomicrobiae bacterium]|nr:DUF192 domain-containing protein [Verrucomicrobiae bacterium]
NAARAVGLALALGLAACAQPAPRVDAVSGLELEQLTVETANGPVQFTVEIADDDRERNQGLMYRRSLADDRGMLFHFQEPEHASFWMRNTILSLDIIFIGTDGRILNIADHTTPYSEAPIPATGLTRGVLEIRAGRAEELGIRPGDHVRHRIFQ